MNLHHRIMFRILFVIVVLFCVISPSYSEDIIDSVVFEGLKKTKKNYLLRLIHCRPGEMFDPQMLQEDEQTLRNLLIFESVSSNSVNTDEGVSITFACKELITLLPIVNFGSITDNFWFQLGAVDFHFLGYGNILGGYYRYYDRNSFQTFFKAPYLFSKYLGMSLEVGRHVTLEPAYFSEGEADYEVSRSEFSLSGRFNVSVRNHFEFGGGYLTEDYQKESDPSAPGPDEKSFIKHLGKLKYGYEGIDYFYHYLNGFASEFYFEGVHTVGEPDIFWKGLSISRYFHRIGAHGMVATRLRLGLSTNKESPFVPFVLDSYINVRGSGNRVARGTGEITINCEYRHAFYDTLKTAFQGVAFIDWSGWRPAGQKTDEIWKSDNAVAFAGLGIRFYYQKFFNFVFRLDYGISMVDPDEHGLVFGTGQYF